MGNRINVCDADSGGKTGPVLVIDGLTVQGYFQNFKPGKSINNYRVTVNEQPASAGSMLTAECRLNISPNKFGGAAKRSLAQQVRLQVVRSLFISAQQEASNLGNTQLHNTVCSLGVLDKPTGEQVDQAIGLVDGVIELERRYGNLVNAERKQVAGDDADADDVDDVDSTKAREPQPTDLTKGLIRVRVWLSAASVLLHHSDRPTANTDLIPVPDKGMPGGAQTAQVGRERGERRAD